MLDLLIAIGLLAAGYIAGRTRPAARLVDWAETATRRGWRDPRTWFAQPILAVAIVWMWTAHPRRTLANIRSWREAEAAARRPSLPIEVRDLTTGRNPR